MLLDVREAWEVAVCAIDGALHVPMNEVPGALGRLDRERETVVLCHHGVRSQHVGLFLERSGFTRVINLAGGIDAWAREVDPAMATY